MNHLEIALGLFEQAKKRGEVIEADRDAFILGVLITLRRQFEDDML